MCVKTDNEKDLSTDDADRHLFFLEHEVNFLEKELRRYKEALRRACKYIDSLGGGCSVCEHAGRPCALMLERDCVGNIERFFLGEYREFRMEFKETEVSENE